MTCWPSWHPKYAALAASSAGKKVVSSWCSIEGGNVQCDPAAMATAAGVSLEVYTLARYIQSEVGSGTVEERVAVGEAAVNRARMEKGLLQLLLYRQRPGHPNYGYFGPIHGPGGTSTAPYGRWAATSKDPTVATLAIADLVLSGRSNNFAKGADNQNGLEYFSNPAANVRGQATDGDYWVGPLPGVDHMRTFLYRHFGKTPDGPALLQRGLDAVAAGRPKWNIDCVDGAPLSSSKLGLFLLGAAALGITIYAGRVAARHP